VIHFKRNVQALFTGYSQYYLRSFLKVYGLIFVMDTFIETKCVKSYDKTSK